MKVHFACSTSKLNKYKDNYRAICSEIKNLGHTITRDWIEEAIGFYEQGKLEIDREDIYQKSVESILASDVVIAEGTISSFSVGHQITLALNKNKPVLLLSYKSKDDKSYFRNGFIDGIKNPLLSAVTYKDSDLKDILEDFFNKNKRGLSVKFNIVFTKYIENYLDWASFTYKVNKSEYIRQLIEKHMDTDKRYRKYLGTDKKDIES